MVNQNRWRNSSTEHEESDLMFVFVDVMVQEGTDFGVAENVLGFIKPDRKGGSVSPLQRLIEYKNKKAPHLKIGLFFLDAADYLVFERRRIFITFHSDRTGGNHTIARQGDMVKARTCKHTLQKTSLLAKMPIDP